MAPSKRPLERSREPAEADTAKQTKQQRMDPENFPRGTLIKIRCKDFMTYKDAVFKPSPRLNLILAPNGAGKSSLTCALCLGLAGDPKILGRADKAVNFIRRGQEEALTEVTLSAGPGKYPLVIQRRLTKDNLSKYRVNGVEKRRSDVVDLMKDLNVQLDNLCQFLPQDKVQSFAQMTPKQLLEESERALADGKYYQIHQELVEETKLLEDSERVTNALQRNLGDEEKLLAEVQRDKARFDQRQKLEEQAELMEFRVAWLDAEQARLQAKDYEEKLKQGVSQLSERQQELQESQAPVKERADAEQRQKKIVGGLTATVTNAESALDEANEKCATLAERTQQKWEDIEGLKEQAARQQQDVAKAEAALAKAKADLEGLPGLEESASQNAGDADAMRAELRDLAAQIADYEQNIAGLKGNYDDYSRDLHRHQEQAKRLDDAKNIKLRQLEYSSRGITDFTRWVEKAKADGMFRGEVLGPILLEVAISEPQHAKYLEQQMPQNIWPRFVTVFHEDQDLLRKAAGERNYRSLYCTNYTGNSTTPLQYPSGRAEEYSMQGVTHTLDQVFNAPLLIKKVMNDESGITRAFVGTGNCDWKTLMGDNHRVRNLYTPESNYRKSASEYNPAARTKSVSAIRDALRFLGGAQDDREERNQLQQLIADGRGAVDAIKKEALTLEELSAQATKQCTEKRIALRRLENQALERKNRKGKLEAAVKAKEKMLQVMRGKPDPMQRAEGLQRDIAKLNTQTEPAVKKVLADFKKLCGSHRELGCAAALHHEIRAQMVALQEQHKGADHAVRKAKQLVDRLQELHDGQKKTAKRKAAAAQDLTGRLDANLKEALNAMSSDVEELQADIERLHHEAAVIQCGNPRVEQEFQERTEKVRNLKEDFAHASTGLQALTAAVEEKKASWLPEIQRMVQTVNSHFQRMLSGMGCNGQVSLYCGCPDFDGCNAFEKYAIHIRVKFRDEEELQLLTANRQSGGERAVCTILYIVALQHVTVTPFRVVDEINQGMDRVNERKVFIQMVDAACRPGTPQCFMFTPKLLPDLPYTYDVMPMTIFNGLHNDELTADLGDDCFAKGMPIVYQGPIAA